jgi:hypothetical protein
MAKGIYTPIRTDDEWEDAYFRWAYECERNLTKTSELTGIPLRTLTYHKAKHEWDERYASETTSIAEFALEGGLNELRLGIGTAALQLVRDASNPNLHPEDRLASQKLLFSLVTNTLRTEGMQPNHLSLIDARSISVLPNDISNKVSATQAIEANLSAALTEQSYSKRGKTRN